MKNFKNYEMLLTGDEKGGRTGSIKKESRKRNKKEKSRNYESKLLL
ncbi:hypothetical protein [Streptococcus pneumoniae]|nr:hypothetical protein [Streptococcus pneumoniae]